MSVAGAVQKMHEYSSSEKIAARMANTAGLREKRYAKSGKSTGMPILDLMYDYDAKGTITRVTSRENTTAALAFFEETYAYDWLDRVTRSVGPVQR